MKIQEDTWIRATPTLQERTLVAEYSFSIITTKTVHCRGKNTAGANYSSILFRVEKPGDAPSNLRVLGVDARDAVVVWEAPAKSNLPIRVGYSILEIPRIE